MNSNPWNKSFIFCSKMDGELLTPIGRRLLWYFTYGGIFGHKLLASSVSHI